MSMVSNNSIFASSNEGDISGSSEDRINSSVEIKKEEFLKNSDS